MFSFFQVLSTKEENFKLGNIEWKLHCSYKISGRLDIRRKIKADTVRVLPACTGYK
jgi:hypothetical protein